MIHTEIESHPYLEEAIQSPYQTGQKSHILPNCSVIISGQSTEDMITDMDFGMTQYAQSISVYQNLLKVKGRRLRNWKQNTHWHWIWMRENGCSLDFNFISLSNPAVDKNWVCQHHLQQFIFGKWCHIMLYDVSLCSNFLRMAYLLNVSTFVVVAQIESYTFFLLFSSAHFTDHQLHFSYSIILALCVLLCCMHFSYHWHKIGNVSRQLTQIYKTVKLKQQDPCTMYSCTFGKGWVGRGCLYFIGMNVLW